MIETYAIPDFAMCEERFGVRGGEHVQRMLAYLKAFVEGSGLEGCIRCNTEVCVIEIAGGSWKVCEKHTGHVTQSGITKIDAVGSTNQPSMPSRPKPAGVEPANDGSFE